MKLYLSPKASWQYQTLKGKSVRYAEQVKTLFQDIKEHPLEGIGTPEPVDAAFPGYWERRFNGSGMVMYYYEGDYVVVISIINELLPSQEELPPRLKKMSQEDYAQVIRQMEANRGHGDDPKVGIFWYNESLKELFGIVSQPILDYVKAKASGIVSCVEKHEDVWRREYNRQKYHGDGSGPYIGPYEQKPRGRVFYQMEEDRFIVAVGKWLDEYPEARELILKEFDLPAGKTSFEYAIHWDIGHTWR